MIPWFVSICMEHAADLNQVLSDIARSLPVTAILDMSIARKQILEALE